MLPTDCALSSASVFDYSEMAAISGEVYVGGIEAETQGAQQFAQISEQVKRSLEDALPKIEKKTGNTSCQCKRIDAYGLDRRRSPRVSPWNPPTLIMFYHHNTIRHTLSGDCTID
mmetsp:Transcript_4240/g.12104  ORF Transcript_4240/g.12104 Transcript_4240/m.12104 type:complete len:115 (-) Transcript_4240:91-435(-)